MLEPFQIVDLTHLLHEGVPTWSGRCGFRLEIRVDYEQGLRAQTVKGHAGVGTHMDAPSHFIPGSWNISDIPLERLIIPACILNLRKEMSPDLMILPHHIEEYEHQYGKIEEKSLVIASTGWEKYWNEPEKYRNADSSGQLHFPSFSKETAELLVKRKIAGIGIDTLSPDKGPLFPVHQAILGAQMYILENLAHLDRMPAKGAYVIAFPQKARDASESTARVAGLIPKKN